MRYALAHAIERSCANKAEVVAADERETAREGGRALLNLGHTFGHAIETGVGYGEWLHGEAVAAGTVMAAELSARLGWLTGADVERVRHLLVRAGLPVVGAELGADRYLDLMGHDKKVIAGRLRLVLLKRLGEAITYADAAPVRHPCRHRNLLCLNSRRTPSARPIRAAASMPSRHRSCAVNSSATATVSFTPPRFADSNTRHRYSSIMKATCFVPV